MKDEAPYYIKKILNETADVTIGSKTIKAEVARTASAHQKGLSGRESLISGHGMLFVFDSEAIRPFTMLDMKFGLDIIWILNGSIVFIEHGAEPGTQNINPQVPSNYVLEVSPSTVRNADWKVGDEVIITFDREE